MRNGMLTWQKVDERGSVYNLVQVNVQYTGPVIILWTLASLQSVILLFFIYTSTAAGLNSETSLTLVGSPVESAELKAGE